MRCLSALMVFSFLLIRPVPAGADDMAEALEAYDGGRYAEALALWRRSAEAGDIDAMTAVANMYLQGEGVRADTDKAVEWYRRAANRGSAVGQLNLGDLLSRGRPSSSDRIEAYVWLGLASGQGNVWAAERQRHLANRMSATEIGRARARMEAFEPRGP